MPVENREIRIEDARCVPLLDTQPNPQFVQSTAVCDFAPPRSQGQTSRSAKKRDENPNSLTFGQWLITGNTYTPLESLATLFPYDSDGIACPIAVNNVAYLSLLYENCVLQIQAARNFTTQPTEIVISFEIAKTGFPFNGSASFSITIAEENFENVEYYIYPLEINSEYVYGNITVSDNSYQAPEAGVIVGTPDPVGC